jgi:hypothetical protein
LAQEALALLEIPARTVLILCFPLLPQLEAEGVLKVMQAEAKAPVRVARAVAMDLLALLLEAEL